MESQPQNPEFRNNPENFHPCLNEAIQINTHNTLCSHEDRKVNTKVSS